MLNESDLEGPVLNSARLPDELVYALLPQNAVAITVDVGPVRLAWRLPVEQDTQPSWHSINMGVPGTGPSGDAKCSVRS